MVRMLIKALYSVSMATTESQVPGLEAYNTLCLPVASSTQISSRVTAILDHLKTTGTKSSLVRLDGRPGVSNKVVSIAEIAKRELAAKVYQYNQLTSTKITVKPKTTDNSNGKDGTSDGDKDDDDAFQAMAAPDKVHDVPVLSIYLSTSSVDSLRKQLG